jgi:hypothetical protein
MTRNTAVLVAFSAAGLSFGLMLRFARTGFRLLRPQTCNCPDCVEARNLTNGI